MRLKILLLLVSACHIPYAAAQEQAQGRLVLVSTAKAPALVTEQLRNNIEKRGMKIFAEIAHHDEAEKAGETLRFTHVFVFGNPKVGTRLMQCDQRIGYELPLRILVSVNTEGRTEMRFRDPRDFSAEYDMKQCKEVVDRMSALLHAITAESK